MNDILLGRRKTSPCRIKELEDAYNIQYTLLFRDRAIMIWCGFEVEIGGSAVLERDFRAGAQVAAIVYVQYCEVETVCRVCSFQR